MCILCHMQIDLWQSPFADVKGIREYTDVEEMAILSMTGWGGATATRRNRQMSAAL